MWTELIGWSASAILLTTLIRQIIKQARAPADAGVSIWLFAGQALASTLFVIYSLLLENWVFVVTNVCLLVTAVVGQCVAMSKRRAQPRQDGDAG